MRPPLRPPNEPDDDARRDDAPAPVESSPASEAAPTDLLEILDPIPDVDPVDNPFGLSPRELLFVEAFVGPAGFRAAAAYEIAGYKTSGAASRANASRMLTRERVAAAIAAKLGERVKTMRMMDGDEALEGISNMGRVDIRRCFPENSSIAKLPDDVADAVKAVTPTKFGYRIEMYDKLRARELMAKAAGKLKDVVKVEHTLEDILAAANRSDPEAGQS
jgi:hypothetical protein